MRIRSILCAWMLAQASLNSLNAGGNVAPLKVALELETTLNTYLRDSGNACAEMTTTKVVRLSSGRISEKVYHVEFLIRDHVQRIAQYSHGKVEGERLWYDIRQTLIFPSGLSAEWRHPGFPGQLSFGQKSGNAHRIRHAAAEVGDVFYPQKRVLQVLSKHRVYEADESLEDIVVRSRLADPDKNDSDEVIADYIEIRFSKEFDLLPVAMIRICNIDNPDQTFESGACLKMAYEKDEKGHVIPVSASRDTRLKEDVKGLLATTWKVISFEQRQPEKDRLKLTLPSNVLAVDADAGRSFTVNDAVDDDLKLLPQPLSQFVSVLSRSEAKRSVAKAFVGQCPDLPDDYRHLRLDADIRASESRDVKSRFGFFLLHGGGLMVAGLLFMRRRKTPSYPAS